MCKKLMKITFVIMLVCGVAGITRAQSPFKETAENLSEAMPPQVLNLFKWPDVSVLSGPKRVSEDANSSVRVKQAKTLSIEWIKKILKPEWIPNDDDFIKKNLIMIRKGFDSFDAIYIQWNQKGFNIKVSQTMGIITIKLTPLQSRDMGNTTDEKRCFARELCRQIMNDTGVRKGLDVNNKPIGVPVTSLDTKIVKYSFRPELLREFSDGSIAGISSNPEQEGVNHKNRNGSEINEENRIDNPNWDSSLSSWSYWWRYVNWWHDGNSVGFFILKYEAGPIAFDYWDNSGNEWF